MLNLWAGMKQVKKNVQVCMILCSYVAEWIILDLFLTGPTAEEHRGSSRSFLVDCIIGPALNRLRITHLAAYEHHAMHSCALILTCFISA
jgi:hypothetical protein